MSCFDWINDTLHCEQIPLDKIAHHFGTPCYVYSAQALKDNYNDLKHALAEYHLNAHIHFAVKANSNIHVLRCLADEGAGADIVSQGEMLRALAAGINPENIIFSGIGKSDMELAASIEHRISQINIESQEELLALARIAKKLNQSINIAIRVNPDIDAKTHHKISTGNKYNKFGIALEDAFALFELARTYPLINPSGIAVHIGSQIMTLEPWRQTYQHIRKLYQDLMASGFNITTLDLGGGLGIAYQQHETPLSNRNWAQLIAQTLGDLPVRFAIEPGRSICATAGVLLTRVMRVKHNHEHTFVIVDAAMNDLMRPALYDSQHTLVPIKKPASTATLKPVNIVGPICESSDVFATNYMTNPLVQNDLACFLDAGAYGAVIANSYNSRALISEIMVHGQNIICARPKTTIETQIALEQGAQWQQNF